MADFRSVVWLFFVQQFVPDLKSIPYFETSKSRKEENGIEDESLLQMEYTKRPDVRIGKNRFIADIILICVHYLRYLFMDVWDLDTSMMINFQSAISVIFAKLPIFSLFAKHIETLIE